MTLLKACLAALKLVQGILGWIERNNIEDAAIARITLNSLRQADEQIKKAQTASKAAHDAPIDGDNDGVPDDDGHRYD